MSRRGTRHTRFVWVAALAAMLLALGTRQWLQPITFSAPQAEAIQSDLPQTEGIEVFFAPASAKPGHDIDSALLATIASARQRICGAVYDLQWDKAADALIERHAHGVAVRLVSDTEYQDRPAMQRCIAAGIPVIFDQRGAFMHNKFLVVDERVVWTGSTNFTENCLFKNNNNSLRILSPGLAENYATEFEEMYSQRLFGGRSPRATPHAEMRINTVETGTYFAPEDQVARAITQEILLASRYVDVLAFAFTSKPLAQALAQRIAAGVRVRGVVEKRSINQAACQDDFLNASGAQIRADANPGSMHHKVVLVDGRTVITGSYNFSKNAEEENDENLLILRSESLATVYAAEFESLWSATP